MSEMSEAASGSGTELRYGDLHLTLDLLRVRGSRA